MDQKVLARVMEQLRAELRTLDAVIADLERFQQLQAGKVGRGRPRKRPFPRPTPKNPK